jgi:type II secretory pathway component PulC
MKHVTHHVLIPWGLATGLWVFGASFASAASPKATAAKPATNTPPAVLEVPQSAFQVDDAKGINPFFPKKKMAISPASEPPTPMANLKLRGIIGSPQRRIALINNQSFQVGEEAAVTIGNKKQHVRCIAIQDQAVIVEVGPDKQQKRLSLNAD